LAISDTGSGISTEIQSHIFEPFFTTKERGKGTGLGLAQVYGIVKQHQGYIDVESELTQGTTFTIYFPALIGAEPEVEDTATVEIPRGHGETILLVEDEPDVLEVNQILLEELGYQVLAATNGKQALEIYATHKEKIALVLTDMVMPEMDGLALNEALKVQHPGVKMVLMSGYPLNVESSLLLSDGIVNWLQKPIELRHMAQVISQALDVAQK
jgi:CheY-like chemotaxis protein